MLTLYVLIQSSAAVLGQRWADLARRRRQASGQASAEYALVLLGAAAVALLVTSWAARTNRVGKLLDGVMDRLLSHVP